MEVLVIQPGDKEQLDKVFSIREQVFVIEQEVAPEEEYDEFEEVAIHFLAIDNGVPCGTARWRYTDKGIKLERFAVLESHRGKGVGTALVDAVLKNIASTGQIKGKTIYLHSQLAAMPLYTKFNFKKQGNMFEECGIQHFKMIK